MKSYKKSPLNNNYNKGCLWFFIVSIFLAAVCVGTGSDPSVNGQSEDIEYLQGVIENTRSNMVLADSSASLHLAQLATLPDAKVYKLVESYLEHGNGQQAIGYLETTLKGIQDSTEYTGLLNYKATVHLRMQDTLDAIDCYLDLAAYDRRTGRFDNQAGRLYTQLAAYGQAIQVFDQAIAKEDDQAMYHYNLGIVYAYLKRRNKAIQSFGRARELGHLPSCELYRNLTAKTNYKEVTYCCDGIASPSNAKGRGACSGHKGVCETRKEAYTSYQVAACK